MHFPNEETVRKRSTVTLKSAEVLLLTTYLGRRTSRMKANEIPLKIDITWLATVLIRGLKDTITIIQATNYHAQHWIGQSLEMISQAAPQGVEASPSSILVGRESKPQSFNGSGEMRCYKCLEKDHISFECKKGQNQSTTKRRKLLPHLQEEEP